MRLATTIADFRGYCENNAQAVRAYEGTGFTHLDYSFYVENYEGSPFMSDDWVKEISAAAKEAEKLGFDFVQAHSPRNDYFCDDRETVIKGNIRSIEACAYLGIKNLVVHSGRSAKFQNPDDMEKYMDGVQEFYEALYPAMEKYNVRVLAENYTPSSRNECAFYSGEQLAEFIDRCNHPLLGVCWDIGHGNLINPEQYGDLATLGERLCAVHIQDNLGKNDNHLCPFMGTTDIDAVMRGLRDSGFIERNGVFTFECDNIIMRAKHRHESGEIIANEPSFAVKRAAITLMYEIGKDILIKYGCFDG